MKNSEVHNGAQRFKRIAVYCGASSGARSEYVTAARELGNLLVERGIKLVYGGGNAGLMGELARTVRDGLGDEAVLSVIPDSLQPREVSGEMIGEVKIVPNIHIRKAMMSREADAFIAIPGGFGTLEELLEMVTWQQLGYHQKPVGVLNVCGFFNHLIKFADHITQEGFVRPASREILQAAESADELLDKLQTYKAPASLISVLATENDAEDQKQRH